MSEDHDPRSEGEPAELLSGRFAEELRRPSTWSPPPAGLSDAVLASVRAAAESPAPPPIPLTPRPQRRGGTWRIASVAAAAAALIAVGSVATDRYLTTRASGQVTYTAVGTPLAPDATARVRISQTGSGFWIRVDASGLPAAGTGSYYAAWLRGADGVMVPLGSFHERQPGPTVELWSGVDPADYVVFMVTLQSTQAPPTPSEQVVLRAPLTR